jgi:hypothetical protein
MYRKELNQYVGKKTYFEGVIDKTYKPSKKTMCITDVHAQNDENVVDHVWLNDEANPILEKIVSCQKPGESIRFKGTVSMYQRKNGTFDYCIVGIDFIKIGCKIFNSKWDVI